MAAVQRVLVHKQFNSPIGLYSDRNVKDTLDRELKTLSNGVIGIDFEHDRATTAPANLANSAVLRMLEEEEKQQRRVATTTTQERQSRSRYRELDRETVLKINRHHHKREFSWPPKPLPRNRIEEAIYFDENIRKQHEIDHIRAVFDDRKRNLSLDSQLKQINIKKDCTPIITSTTSSYEDLKSVQQQGEFIQRERHQRDRYNRNMNSHHCHQYAWPPITSPENRNSLNKMFYLPDDKIHTGEHELIKQFFDNSTASYQKDNLIFFNEQDIREEINSLDYQHQVKLRSRSCNELPPQIPRKDIIKRSNRSSSAGTSLSRNRYRRRQKLLNEINSTTSRLMKSGSKMNAPNDTRKFNINRKLVATTKSNVAERLPLDESDLINLETNINRRCGNKNNYNTPFINTVSEQNDRFDIEKNSFTYNQNRHEKYECEMRPFNDANALRGNIYNDEDILDDVNNKEKKSKLTGKIFELQQQQTQKLDHNYLTDRLTDALAITQIGNQTNMTHPEIVINKNESTSTSASISSLSSLSSSSPAVRESMEFINPARDVDEYNKNRSKSALKWDKKYIKNFFSNDVNSYEKRNVISHAIDLVPRFKNKKGVDNWGNQINENNLSNIKAKTERKNNDDVNGIKVIGKCGKMNKKLPSIIPLNNSGKNYPFLSGIGSANEKRTEKNNESGNREEIVIYANYEDDNVHFCSRDDNYDDSADDEKNRNESESIKITTNDVQHFSDGDNVPNDNDAFNELRGKRDDISFTEDGEFIYGPCDRVMTMYNSSRTVELCEDDKSAGMTHGSLSKQKNCSCCNSDAEHVGEGGWSSFRLKKYDAKKSHQLDECVVICNTRNNKNREKMVHCNEKFSGNNINDAISWHDTETINDNIREINKYNKMSSDVEPVETVVTDDLDAETKDALEVDAAILDLIDFAEIVKRKPDIMNPTYIPIIEACLHDLALLAKKLDNAKRKKDIAKIQSHDDDIQNHFVDYNSINSSVVFKNKPSTEITNKNSNNDYIAEHSHGDDDDDGGGVDKNNNNTNDDMDGVSSLSSSSLQYGRAIFNTKYRDNHVDQFMQSRNIVCDFLRHRREQEELILQNDDTVFIHPVEVPTKTDETIKSLEDLRTHSQNDNVNNSENSSHHKPAALLPTDKSCSKFTELSRDYVKSSEYYDDKEMYVAATKPTLASTVKTATVTNENDKLKIPIIRQETQVDGDRIVKNEDYENNFMTNGNDTKVRQKPSLLAPQSPPLSSPFKSSLSSKIRNDINYNLDDFNDDTITIKHLNKQSEREISASAPSPITSLGLRGRANSNPCTPSKDLYDQKNYHITRQHSFDSSSEQKYFEAPRLFMSGRFQRTEGLKRVAWPPPSDNQIPTQQQQQQQQQPHQVPIQTQAGANYQQTPVPSQQNYYDGAPPHHQQQQQQQPQQQAYYPQAHQQQQPQSQPQQQQQQQQHQQPQSPYHHPTQSASPAKQVTTQGKGFSNPVPTYINRPSPSITNLSPRPAYLRGSSPSTAAFSGGIAVDPSQKPKQPLYQQQRSYSQPAATTPVYASAAPLETFSPPLSASQTPQYSSFEPVSPSTNYSTSPRGWAHVNSATPQHMGYTQQFQPQTNVQPPFEVQSSQPTSYIGSQQNQYQPQATQAFRPVPIQSYAQPQQQAYQPQQQAYQPQQQAHQPQQQAYQPQQQAYQPQQQAFQPQQQYQPQQQQQQAFQTQQQYQPQQQQYQSQPQHQYQQEQYQPITNRQQSPGFITLRNEPPISQKPAPVFQSQPPVSSFQGGANMRGDQKWPPVEYKQQAAAENEARLRLAAGPECRPRRVNKDYRGFFAKHALNSSYPGYKVPPGTQHVGQSSM